MTSGHEWRKGWTVVLAAAMGCGMGTTPIYSFGAFVAPLSAEFGWTRAQITSAASICILVTALSSPIVGRLVDRWGTRRVALSSTAYLCCVFASLSLVGNSVGSFLTIWSFVAIGAALASPLVWTIAVATRFAANRGLALALTLCGSNLAAAFSSAIVTLLTQKFGWRWAYIGLALCMLLAAFPLALLSLFDAGDLARHRNAVSSPAAAKSPDPAAVGDGLNLREAVATPTFWIIAASLFLAGGAIVSMIIYLIPILIDRGLRPMEAAAAVSAMNVAAIIGRVSAGFFLDRVFAPRVTAVAFTSAILACLLLLHTPQTLAGALVAAVFLGLAIGAEADLIGFLTARYFGFKTYGSVYGILFGIFTLGSSTAPPVVGLIFQATGSYYRALAVLAGCFLGSASILQLCGRYPVWRSRPAISAIPIEAAAE